MRNIITARDTGTGNFVFLCAACNGVHIHGAGNGHRISHCANHPGGYYLEADIEAAPGTLTDTEMQEVHQMLTTANDCLRAVAEYLTLAGIEEQPDLQSTITTLAEWVDVPSHRRNKIERLTAMPPLAGEAAHTAPPTPSAG